MLALLLLQLFGCDDTVFPVPEAPTGDGWCGVQALLTGECVTCHSARSALGGLDLETDPSVVLEATSASGEPYVVPGDAAASFLYRKLSGDLQGGEGTVMPPSGSPPAEVLDMVAAWIDGGASMEGDCAGGGSMMRYHPVGWADPDVHGTEAKLQQQRCTECHGQDLRGGSGPSCDSCHGSPTASDAWRTDCTFCHGEPGGSGAPPRQIDGSLDPSGSTFPAHRPHTDEAIFALPFDCDTCHAVPTDVMSPGHLFVDDDTPGRAEVTLEQGTWDGSSCAGTCHGPDPFPATGTADCGSCHGVNLANQLSGEHGEHAAEGVDCESCHDTALRVGGTITIDRIEQHVNGTVELALPPEISRDAAGRCDGTCHGQAHTAASW